MPSDPAKNIWPRVIGQHRVKKIILNSLRSDRLPHAYLFYGAEGVGKDAMALELARVIHCMTGGDHACGSCASCLQLDSLQHPDVRFIVSLPVGKGEKADDPPLAKLSEDEIGLIRDQLRLKGKNPYHRIRIPRATVIKINSIRDVRREASMSTTDGRRRVFIISRAEEIGTEAANTILKTLEEPSGKTMLILTTANKEALLPTIISRCQGVRFDPLTEIEVRSALIDREAADPRKADLVTRLGHGSYTRAMELLEEDLSDEREQVVGFIRHALGRNLVDFVSVIDSTLAGADREQVSRFLQLVLIWFRDALVHSNGGAIVNIDQQTDINRFTTNFPDANLPQVIRDVEHALFLVERNVYIKLILLQLATKLRRSILPDTMRRWTGIPRKA